ncbi:MAG TPA: hypothetical protein VLK84_13830 [Longimicrobium sp.]|nr:hypothetical protein [Longimicrobium sp.]
MKKLRLDADALRVESFPTDPAARETGTVHGLAPTLQLGSCPAPLCRTYDDTLCGLTQAC